MDSPGNDLESTAGQTASGCNFIAFTTGNGAVTNHPLVPTSKIITTTRRYQLVGSDMDFNAGRLMDGCGTGEQHTVETLGKELYEMIIRQASGLEKTKGETHGHAGTQLWRDWISLEEGVSDPVEEAKTTEAENDQVQGQGDETSVKESMLKESMVKESMLKETVLKETVVLDKPNDVWLEQFHNRDLDGHSVELKKFKKVSKDENDDLDGIVCTYLMKPNGTLALSRLGLVLPTSLCSSQVCVGIVDQLNATLKTSKTSENEDVNESTEHSNSKFIESNPSNASNASNANKSNTSTKTPDDYYYKIDGKSVSKAYYLEYENQPGFMEGGGKQTNNPDVYGRIVNNHGRDAPTSVTEVSRFITLQHSEGCGVSAFKGSDQIEQRVLIGHLTHPSIDPARAVLLEHGESNVKCL